MRTKHDADQYRVSNETERSLYHAGVPYDFWVPTDKPIAFESIQRPTGIVSTEDQQMANVSKFADPDVWYTNTHAVLASNPTHYRARQVAYKLLRDPILKGVRVQIDRPGEIDDPNDSTVFVMDAAYDTPNVDLRWKVRKWLRDREDRFCLVLVAGQAINYVDNYGVWPDVGFQLLENQKTWDEWV